MNNRAKILSALASAGILAAGWQIGTADGGTLVATGGTGPAASEEGGPAPGSLPRWSDDEHSDDEHSDDEHSDDDHDDDDDQVRPASASSTLAPARSSGTSTKGQSGTATGAFTGATARHRYGSVTVTVTLDRGRITALSEKVISDGDRKSISINNRAVPILKQALVGTDGSTTSTISGATYTTEAYLTSLQAALDSAR